MSSTVQSISAEELFSRCTERKLMKDGSLEIYCKKGFWSVSSTDHKAAEQEARGYWWQYFVDGEYGNIWQLLKP